MKKFLIILLTIFLSKLGFSQEPQFSYAKFEYKHSLRIPYNYLIIEVSQSNRDKKARIKIFSKPASNKKEWEYSKIDTVFDISSKKFAKLTDSISKINGTNFIKKGLSGNYSTDGFLTKITYGDLFNNITYRIESLDPNKKKFETFYNSCLLFLDLATIEREKIFGDASKKYFSEKEKQAILEKIRKKGGNLKFTE